MILGTQDKSKVEVLIRFSYYGNFLRLNYLSTQINIWPDNGTFYEPNHFLIAIFNSVQNVPRPVQVLANRIISQKAGVKPYFFS